MGKNQMDAKLNFVINGTILSRFSADFDFNLNFLRRAKRLPNENVSPKSNSNNNNKQPKSVRPCKAEKCYCF